MSSEQALALAQDPATSNTMLCQLSHDFPQVAHFLANWSLTSDKLLDHLIDLHQQSVVDADVARAVYAHSAASVATLRRGVREFPSVVFRNPKLRKLLASQKHHGKLELCIEPSGEPNLFSSSEVPDALVDYLAASADFTISARYLFGHTTRSAETVAKFWKSPTVLIVEQLVTRDTDTYLQWARDLGFAGPLPDGCASDEVRIIIDEWVQSLHNQQYELWERFIPKTGSVKTVQGQLLFAMVNVDNACRDESLEWDDYIDALKSYVFGEVDARKNFSHLVASTFVNDSSELRSALPWSGRQQVPNSIEFLQPTDCRIRLARIWVVAIRWLLKQTKQIEYSGKVESDFNIKTGPRELYRSKPRSTKLPKLDSYAKWAIELGLDKNDLRGFSKRHDIHLFIDDWVSDICAESVNIWRDLVPSQGVSSTLQGEIIRAHGRIEYDLLRNGLMNWGVYYKEFLKIINITLSNDHIFSDQVKMGIEVDCSVIERAGESAGADEIVGTGTGPTFGALGDSFFARTDVESALKRLGALIVIWIRRNTMAIPYVVGDSPD
jgi:hypothetical protein